MRFLLRLVILLLVLAAAAWAFAFSGLYNVAATEPHWKPVQKFLMFAMDRSVDHHAEDIKAPANLQDTAVIHKGFEHFQEMCVQCHGAPGVKHSEMAEGLNPHAPKLVWAAKEDEPGELFWVTKNGIKMTGMPAFGPTHTDEEIWAIVAFMKQLPNLDSAGYAALREKWCDKGAMGEMEGMSDMEIQCHKMAMDMDCHRMKPEDCKRMKMGGMSSHMDCERQSDGTSHSHHP